MPGAPALKSDTPQHSHRKKKSSRKSSHRDNGSFAVVVVVVVVAVVVVIDELNVCFVEYDALPNEMASERTRGTLMLSATSEIKRDDSLTARKSKKVILLQYEHDDATDAHDAVVYDRSVRGGAYGGGWSRRVRCGVARDVARHGGCRQGRARRRRSSGTPASLFGKVRGSSCC
jgi:hypothetical protein